MEEKNDFTSVLIMDKLVFEKIKFERNGMQNDNEIKFNLQVMVRRNKEEDIYKVTLILSGDKEKEYELEISVSGIFSFKNLESITEEDKETLITKNAVAIIMPYLRSEVSLLTAQPNVDCVVLPVFDINKFVEE